MSDKNILIKSDYVSELVTLSNNVTIHEDVKILDGVTIQENVIIHKNTIVQEGAFICKNVVIGHNVFIGKGVIINENTSIADNAVIFPGSEICRNKKNVTHSLVLNGLNDIEWLTAFISDNKLYISFNSIEYKLEQFSKVLPMEYVNVLHLIETWFLLKAS